MRESERTRLREEAASRAAADALEAALGRRRKAAVFVTETEAERAHGWPATLRREEAEEPEGEMRAHDKARRARSREWGAHASPHCYPGRAAPH